MGNLAKKIVRDRQSVKKSMAMRNHVEVTQQQLKDVDMQERAVKNMKKLTKMLNTTSRVMDTQTIAKIGEQYQQELMKQEITQGLVDDALNEAMEGNADEEEEEVNKVMEEIGLQREGEMGVGGGATALPALGEKQRQAEEKQDEEDIESRLAALKR